MLPSFWRDAGAVAERLVELERALVVGERLLVLAERGEHHAHVVERAGLLAAHAERAVDHERLGVALDRRLEPADVPQRGAALVEDGGARDQDRRRRAAGVGGGAIAQRERLLDQPQRVLGVADQAGDRGAQAQASASSSGSLGVARVLLGGAGRAQRRGGLADVDVELGERAVRGGEPGRIAELLGRLAQGVELAQLLRPAGEPAQDLLAQPVGGEPALVIVGRQQLEGARQLAERVGVAAEVDGVAGGAQVAVRGGGGVARELEVARDQRVVLADAVGRRAGDPRGDRAVHLDAGLRREQAVRDGHRHVVLEPVLVDLGPRRQQAAADQLVELQPGRPAEQLRQRRRGDVAAEHRGVDQRLALRRRAARRAATAAGPRWSTAPGSARRA